MREPWYMRVDPEKIRLAGDIWKLVGGIALVLYAMVLGFRIMHGGQ